MLNGRKNPPRYEKNSHTGSIHEVRYIGINLLAILDIHYLIEMSITLKIFLSLLNENLFIKKCLLNRNQ